ncbi:MAG TPA: APC family permease, partial [Dehalococcoidia bacterium]|nr:APC family permease [Dehalococcoidia bacterium]
GRSFIRIPRPVLPPSSDGQKPMPAPTDARRQKRPAEAGSSTNQDHERIVIPRQDRGSPPHSDIDVELREVRYGAASRGPYLRVVPRRSHFVRAAPGHLQATALASRPDGGPARYLAAAKALIIGSPFATSRLIHERLTKVRALGVFSSDPLSSSAYSAEEIMLVLVLAGSAALYLALPITAVLLALLWVVRLSYIQTINAYPNGGGAYIVGRENIGVGAGLVAASALMVDYVLTAAVSVAAGVAAITSAAPSLLDLRVPIALLAVTIITWGNLRGIRESGLLFGLPTYFFIVAFSGMITLGLVKLVIGDAPGSLLHSAPPTHQVAAVGGLSVFLVLRAFSSGAAAVTGIEAISNGIPSFKPPESKNAAITMQWEAAFLGFFLLGVAFLATRYGLVPVQDETIVSTLGRSILGKNVLYYAYQVATAGVLFLAANTAYADFPRLAAILANDRFAPRQMAFRGDRLAFSNGIMLLGLAAAALLVIFQAEVTKLIPLYILGVFISMTISQSGMIRHWLRLRGHGWRLSLFINGMGAVATAIVVVIVGMTKFTEGAWISVIAIASLLAVFILIHRHYNWYQRQVQLDEDELPGVIPTAVAVQPGGPASHVVVPVDGTNRITMSAIAFARELSPFVTAVHVADDVERAREFRRTWEDAVPDVPLLVIESPYRAFVAPFAAFIRQVQEGKPGQKVTVVLPAFAVHHWWERILHNQDVHRLRRALGKSRGLNVVEFTYDLVSQRAVSPSLNSRATSAT